MYPHYLFQHGSDDFQKLITTIEEANKLELHAIVEKQKADELDSIATYILLKTNNKEQGEALQAEAAQLRHNVVEMVH